MFIKVIFLFIIIVYSIHSSAALGSSQNLRDSLNTLKVEYKNASSAVKMADLKNKIVALHLRLEELDIAKQLIEENLVSAKTGKLPDSVTAATWLNRGSYYLIKADMEEAKANFLKSLDIYRKIYGEKDARTAYAYSALGQYFNNRVLQDSALIYTRKALDIIESLKGDTKGIAVELIYANYAYALKVNNWLKSDRERDELYNQVREIFWKAVEISRQKYGKNSFNEAMLLHHIANTYTDETARYKRLNRDWLNVFNTAMLYYEKSFEIFKKNIGEKSNRCATSYYTRGLLYQYTFGKDSIEMAINYLDKAMETLEINFDIRNPGEMPVRISSINNYQLYILLFNKDWFINSTSDYQLTNEQKHHLEFISRLQLKLWDQFLEDFNSDNIHQLLTLYSILPFKNVIKYELEKNSVENAFIISDKSKYAQILKSTVSASNKGSLSLKEHDIQSLQKSLSENTALIEYFSTEMELIVFILTSNKIESLTIPKPTDFAQQISEFKKSIIDSDAIVFNELSYMLYNNIFAPIDSLLGSQIEKIKVIPDGALNYLPFEALITNKIDNGKAKFNELTYLIKKYKISYAFNASLLIQKNKVKYNRGLVSFIPDYKIHTPLYFSSKLGEYLQEKFRGKHHIGADATSNKFNSNISCEVLHISAHAKYDNEDYRNSGIYFSDHDGEDKLLLSRIAKNSIHARLGVLIGCETGTGRVEQGEGLIGLTRSMKMAGVENIISTLWQVDDEYSSNILENFYHYLSEGNYPDEALHLAKLHIINNSQTPETANPFYWAGIIYIGDDVEINLHEKQNKLYWAAGIGIMLLITGFSFRRRLKLFN